MTPIQVELPDALIRHAKALAAFDGMAFDQFVANASSDHMAARGSAYLKARAARGCHVDILNILAKVPDVPPVPGHELK